MMHLKASGDKTVNDMLFNWMHCIGQRLARAEEYSMVVLRIGGS